MRPDTLPSLLSAPIITHRLTVQPQDAASYPIIIGENLLDHAGEYILAAHTFKRLIIIADTHTAPLYGARLHQSIMQAGMGAQMVVLPAGEATKSFAQFHHLMEMLLAYMPDRKTGLVALGGGVIGDITGFAASILLRGVPFIQIPTTVLAQVDSSVGGKTAINSMHGKNLLGSFYQPKLVLADLTTLATLPVRERLAGYAEIVKYGLINQPAFFDWLEENGAQVLAGHTQALAHAVHASCCAKAAIVNADTREQGERALLNFGHTFGHALEKHLQYDNRLLHGEAVAVGSLMAMKLSVERGVCPQQDYVRLHQHLQAVGMPVHLRHIDTDWNAQLLASYCQQDKKVEDGTLTFILARGIGQAFITQDVTLQEAEHVFAQFI